MAHRFIIDDQTGQLYKDFTGRRLTSAAEVLKAERGLAPTFEIFLIVKEPPVSINTFLPFFSNSFISLI